MHTLIVGSVPNHGLGTGPTGPHSNGSLSSQHRTRSSRSWNQLLCQDVLLNTTSRYANTNPVITRAPVVAPFCTRAAYLQM
jgi:hypothetical protein